MSDEATGSVRASRFLARTLVPAGMRTTRHADDATSLQEAGWSRAARIEVGHGPFETLRWSNLRTLIAARNEVIVRRLARGDVGGAMRDAWLGALSSRPDPRVPISLVPDAGPTARVLLVGDTGDASESQHAVARQLAGRARAPGAAMQTATVAAVLIESDIVYPAGSSDEFSRKFFDVYEHLHHGGTPIYAVPGNHDWNDGSCSGFFSAFCGVRSCPDEIAEARERAFGGGLRGWLASRLWHSGSPSISPAPWSPSSGANPVAPPQRSPYLALDIGGVLFIGVDTGFGDTIDATQAEWLVRLVEGARGTPKILFSGKPLIVNNSHQPLPFLPRFGRGSFEVEGENGRVYRSVDDVVRLARHGFVAVIGGDIHNYQRYLARRTTEYDAPVLPYVVCGGGGVFLSQTYGLERIDVADASSGEQGICNEHETVLFPPRAHSRLMVDWIIRRAAGRARFTLPIGLAAAAVGVIVDGCVFRSPAWRIAPALACEAIAVNISARPISRNGRIQALIASGSAAALAGSATNRGLRLGDLALDGERVHAWIGAAMVGGTALLMAGESERFDSSRGHRVGRPISGVAALSILTGAGALVLGGLPTTGAGRARAGGIVAIAALTVAVATKRLTRPLTVEQAFDEMTAELGGQPESKARRTLRLSASRWLVRRQRLFSIYQTFTDGRLKTETELRVGGSRRPFLPLYRSLLEIEFRREPDKGADAFEFAFTTHAVTGERTDDVTDGGSSPVCVDAFRVQFAHGAITDVITN